MTTRKFRQYSGKDVEMLTRATNILQAATEHQVQLVAFDTTYSTAFLASFSSRIEDAMDNIVGIDHSVDLRNSTAAVRSLQKEALEDLGLLQMQIKARYTSDKARRHELLTLLGFNQWYIKALRGDQESLMQLLYRVHNYIPETSGSGGSTTTNLRAELENKGIPASRLTNLSALANRFRTANNTQEEQKGDRKELTSECIDELNAIYTEIISLCKIGQKIFKDDQALKDRFVYQKAKHTTEPENDKDEATPSGSN